jgi:O-antigen ligase
VVGRGQSIAALVLVTFVVGYAVVEHGGDQPFHSSLSLFLLGLVAATGSVFLYAPAPFVGRAVIGAGLLLPAYITFQLIPLPLAIVRIVSPTRAEIADALGGIVATPRFAPLTISPPSTSIHLARMAGCSLVLLLVSQIARQSFWCRRVVGLPLIGFAVIETVWALAQSLTGASAVVGSYYNRNHLAGLLEMVMPLVAVYGLSTLLHPNGRGRLNGSDAVRACCSLGLALAMFIVILFSLSKGGTFAALGSLVIMGVLAAEGRASGWRRWALTAGLMLACALTVVFLTPTALVERFAAFGSDDVSEGRLPIWKNTLQIIRAYPLFGVGMGNFYPALLRYQTAGFGLLWTAAHNDYLQMLAELGIVGFVFPAVAVGGAFVRAARTAITADTREIRDVALACAGGLAAFLIHSVSDFNAYVLSNAMVVAWITGISSTLPLGKAAIAVEATPRIRSVIRGYVAAGACLLSGYAGAWLIFLHSFQSDPGAERVFCRFGVCDTESVLAFLRGPQRDTRPAEVPLQNLVAYLERDPALPARWEDLGEALDKAGRIDAARYCVFRALALAPNSPSELLPAAAFQFDRGERRAALDLVSRSLHANVGEPFDEAPFRILERKQVPVTDVLQYGLPDRRSTQAYLRWLFKSDRVADVDQVWEWMVARGDADDKMANEYVDFRLRAKQPDAAAAGFALYARTRSPGYPESNRIFNGDFESDPMGARFDWRLDARSGMTIDFDETVHSSGKRSLRIRFDGTQNPGDIGLEQAVFLPPGRYRFEAHVRTEDVSTDQGVAFRVVSEERQQALDVTTDNVRGSNDWTMLESVFDAPPGGGLTRVSVVRKPSLKFDNLIKGTAWIDQVSISPIRSPTERVP